MPRPKSRAFPLTPCRITDRDTRERTTLYDLDDAKAALGIEPEEYYRDADLLMLIPQAQGILEKQTGLHLSPVQVTAQYENWEDGRAVCLELPESDVIVGQDAYPITVTEYPYNPTRVDPNDPESEVDEYPASTLASTSFAVDVSLQRTYITRTDGKYFPRGCDIVAEVVFHRGLQRDGYRADIARVAMSYLVIELNKVNGVTSPALPQFPAPFVMNPFFQNLVAQLRSSRRIVQQIV